MAAVPLPNHHPPGGVAPSSPRPAPPPSRHAYLPHLDGLRAVALTAILLHHWGVPPFRSGGGFVGVDVFFVLAGYLATATTAAAIAAEPAPGEEGKGRGRGQEQQQQQERRTFSLRDWCGRRFWRLVPAAVATVTATMAAAYVWLPPDVSAAAARAAVAAAGGLSNGYYAATAGHADGAAGGKPLLHTWSVSLGLQFYALWVPALAWLARRHRRLGGGGSGGAATGEGGDGGEDGGGGARRDTVALAVVGGATAASLVAAVATVRVAPATAWYGLPTRGWEFGAGAVAALWSPSRPAPPPGPPQPPPAREEATALAALAVLAATAVCIDRRAVAWPGVATVPAVAATVAVIRTPPNARVARWMLGHPALRLVGRVSYSAYLVHWPVWVVLPYALPPKVLEDMAAGAALPVGAAALTAALTAVLYLAVERPSRTPSGGGTAGGGRGAAAGRDGGGGLPASGGPPPDLVDLAPLLPGGAPAAAVDAAAVPPRHVPSHREIVLVAVALSGILLVTTALATDGWAGRPGRPPPGATALATWYRVPPVPSIELCEQPPPAGYTFPTNITADARRGVCGVGAVAPRQGRGGVGTRPPSPPRLALVLGDSFAGMRRPTAAAAGALVGGRVHFSWMSACPPFVGVSYDDLSARLHAVGVAPDDRRRACRTAHAVWQSMMAGGYAPPGGGRASAGRRGRVVRARPATRRAVVIAAGERAVRAAAAAAAAALPPPPAAVDSTVILAGHWTLYFLRALRTGVDAAGADQMAPLFSATVATLRAAGARRVVVVGAPPLPTYDAEACVAAAASPAWRRAAGGAAAAAGGSDACAAATPVRDRVVRFNDLLRRVVRRIPGAVYVDVFPATCEVGSGGGGGGTPGRLAAARPLRAAGGGRRAAPPRNASATAAGTPPAQDGGAPPPHICAQLWRGAPVYHGRHLTRTGALLEVPLWVQALGGDPAAAGVAVPKEGGER
ncbi:hypothetical protein I4F81_009034 [Pyropia yezoensis]|uniref:Uncharacterized protein n=1 Tax=Pyropia yezoensis TaxID=2788 RepID=A0ACC3C9G5_PYRYE|nr:hypothetical protein I4F81_009034 [Neopyropia yezoensis]